MVTTSDTNGLINVWDIRSPLNPLRTLSGHSKAIKCVKFSPHRESVIGSVSYDMTTRLWDTNTSNGLLFTSQEHKEFVYGFDFNRHLIDQMADCSWDQFVHVFQYSPQYVSRNWILFLMVSNEKSINLMINYFCFSPFILILRFSRISIIISKPIMLFIKRIQKLIHWFLFNHNLY